MGNFVGFLVITSPIWAAILGIVIWSRISGKTPSEQAYDRAKKNRAREIQMGHYDGKLNDDALQYLRDKGKL